MRLNKPGGGGGFAPYGGGYAGLYPSWGGYPGFC